MSTPETPPEPHGEGIGLLSTALEAVVGAVAWVGERLVVVFEYWGS